MIIILNPHLLIPTILNPHLLSNNFNHTTHFPMTSVIPILLVNHIHFLLLINHSFSTDLLLPLAKTKRPPPLETLALLLQLRVEALQATSGLFQLGEPRDPWSSSMVHRVVTRLTMANYGQFMVNLWFIWW